MYTSLISASNLQHICVNEQAPLSYLNPLGKFFKTILSSKNSYPCTSLDVNLIRCSAAISNFTIALVTPYNSRLNSDHSPVPLCAAFDICLVSNCVNNL
jgi:hypothetical protein